ncbi:hypothetical protein RI054_04g21870 [Pseudoscourfieldia marina]
MSPSMSSFVGYADQWCAVSASMEGSSKGSATPASRPFLASSTAASARLASVKNTDDDAEEEMELAFMQVGLPKECVALAPEPAFDTLMNDLNMKKTDSLNMMATNGIAIIA